MSEPSSVRPRLLDPASTFYRWSIMIAAGLMLFGSYFAYDSIAAISQLLIDQAGYTREQVGLMDSLYSWPNVLGTVLIAGILIDRFGTRVMSFILSGGMRSVFMLTRSIPTLTTPWTATFQFIIQKH